MPTLGLLRVLPPWMGRRPLPAKVSLRERSHHAGSDNEPSEQSAAAVRLYWIPLGAGLDVVRLTVARLSGNVFEAVSALARQRPPCDLYHAALEVSLPGRRFVIEMTGAPDRHGCKRGVVCQGAMSAPWLGRFRLFRYEVRCWPGGTIPDAKYAADSPVLVSTDIGKARRLPEAAAAIPVPVWGRDQLRTGEMWNSNSVVSWLLERSGIGTEHVRPPRRGRAPGWATGVVAAALRPVQEPGKRR